MSSRAVAALKEYLAANSAHDLPGVAAHLAEDVEVWMGGACVSRGRDTILPSYTADWDQGNMVTITRPPEAVASDDDAGTVVVSVGLQSAGENVVTLDVLYTYRMADLVQVRHEITITTPPGKDA